VTLHVPDGRGGLIPLDRPLVEITGDFTARAEPKVVHRDSVQPIPLDARVNGQPVVDVEVAAVRGAEPPRYRPATVHDGQAVFLTGGLQPGRYSLLARRGGAVVQAGRLHVT
jgi:hypothetical protein